MDWGNKFLMIEFFCHIFWDVCTKEVFTHLFTVNYCAEEQCFTLFIFAESFAWCSNQLILKEAICRKVSSFGGFCLFESKILLHLNMLFHLRLQGFRSLIFLLSKVAIGHCGEFETINTDWGWWNTYRHKNWQMSDISNMDPKTIRSDHTGIEFQICLHLDLELNKIWQNCDFDEGGLS